MKIINHLKTVLTHKKEVFKLCVKCGIPWQGITHDLSKFSPVEFFPGVRFWNGHESPQVSERKQYGYSLAWLHHKGRNKHHFEYWNDYVAGKGAVPLEMPPRYFVEMICDRIAACKTYLGKNYTDRSALDYYLKAKSHYDMNEKTASDLESVLRYLAEHGENETMSYLKNVFLKK